MTLKNGASVLCPSVQWLTALFVVFVISCATAASPEEGRSALEKWLATSSKVKSVQASFQQVRQLKSLRQPLRKDGQLWMVKGGGFRWQIGDAPDLLVQTDGDGALWVLDGKTKKARVWSKEALEAQEKEGKGQGFAMLNAMQSVSLAEFEERFTLKDARQDAANSDRWSFDLSLKDNKAAVFVVKVTLEGDIREGSLLAMTIQMRDGSTMATLIQSYQLNKPLADSIFKVEANGYEVENQ